MNNHLNAGAIIGWAYGLFILSIGVLNLIMVHPVPGIIYLLLTFLYLPPLYRVLSEKTGFSVPPIFKIILGIVIFFFTFGVSDLGNMIDNWFS